MTSEVNSRATTITPPIVEAKPETKEAKLAQEIEAAKPFSFTEFLNGYESTKYSSQVFLKQYVGVLAKLSVKVTGFDDHGYVRCEAPAGPDVVSVLFKLPDETMIGEKYTLYARLESYDPKDTTQPFRFDLVKFAGKQ